MSRKRLRDTDGDNLAQPVKRRKDYTEEDAKLAKLYDQLSNELQEVQLDAAVNLIEYYIEHERPSSVLTRLIRGLCSSRKAARLGFFTALVEVLRSHEQGDSLKEVLRKTEAHTEPISGASKTEKREHALGKLTALRAIVHAGLLFRKELDFDSINKFLKVTTNIAHKSSTLQEQCGSLWVDYVIHAAANDAALSVEHLLDHLQRTDLLYTPEGVAVWLRARGLTPNIGFPKSIWHDNNPLDPEDSVDGLKLRNALGVTSTHENGESGSKHEVKTSGLARRSPHFVWTVLLDSLFLRSKKARTHSGKDTADSDGTKGTIRRVWMSQVDNVFFKESASPETKALGFQICGISISKAPKEIFEHILSPKMLNCFANQIGSKQRLLHETAKELMEQIENRTTKKGHESDLRDFITAISQDPDAVFDVARTRKTQAVVENTIRSARLPALRALLEYYDKATSALLGPSSIALEDRKEYAKLLVDQIGSIFESTAAKEEEREPSTTLRYYTLRLIFRHACLYPSEEAMAQREADVPVREIFKAKLWSCIREIMTRPVSKDLSNRIPAELFYESTDEACKIVSDLDYDLVIALEGASAGIRMIFEQAQITIGSVLEYLESCRTRPDALSKVNVAMTSHLQGFMTLLATLMLQSYCGDEIAISMLEDLQTIYRNFYEKGINHIEAIICALDTTLYLASKEEVVFRLAAEQTYAAFAPHILEGAKKLLFVLKQEETLAGQSELFGQKSEDVHSSDMQSEVAGSDVEHASDVEVRPANGGVGESEDESEHDESEGVSDDETASSIEEVSQEESDGDDESNAADEALNESLGRILGAARLINVTTNGSDSDRASHSDSDSDMTDSAMEAMNVDGKLADIFRQRGTAGNKSKTSEREDQKKAQKDAKRFVVAFKSRVLGLLSIYVDAKYASHECLSIILPLCKLVGSTRDAQLSKKAADLLERYIRLSRKKQKGLPVDTDDKDLWTLLDEVHEEALLWKGHTHMAACSRAALFVARILVMKVRRGTNDKAAIGVSKKFQKRYEQTRKSNQNAKTGLPETFWDNFRTWKASIGLK